MHIWIRGLAAAKVCLPPKARWTSLVWAAAWGDRLISEGYTELTPPLTWASRGSWSWRYESRIADPTPASCNTQESRPCTLLELWVSHPEDKNMGELALPFVFCEVAWMREMCPAPHYLLQLGDLALLLTSCRTPESRPAPHLAIKVELDLVVGGFW